VIQLELVKAVDVIDGLLIPLSSLVNTPLKFIV